MPSLYEATATVGDVSSSNFTTLYNASNLSVPNAGGGSVSGNLNVGGNLTVQGTSLLIGAVALQNTLTLPNYTFPFNDGTTDQVLTTDGSGNLFFTSVSALGASYTIQADTATGGANLTLVSSGGVLDSVKFAGSGGATITRTDANTITINAADELPPATNQGQVLYWNGTDWEANSVITSILPGLRLTSEYLNSDASISGAFRVRRNFGSTAYGVTDSSTMLYQVTSDTQAVTSIGATGFVAAADPVFLVNSSTDNFTSINRLMAMTSTGVRFNGTNLILNTNHTGAPTLNAVIGVERGSSTDATLTWDESQDRWEFNNALEVQGQITGTANLDLNGDTIVLRSGDISEGNAQIIVNRGTTQDARLTWNDTQDRWEFNESLFGSTAAESPAQFERLVTSAEINNEFEAKAALRLTERVTDAVSNDTDQGGTGIIFSRASGTTPGSAERSYGIISSRFYGTTNTADIALQWSNDNFSEPTPGSFPGTYTLMRAGSNDTTFTNNSLFLNYSTQSTASIATSITGGNTLVFGTAHGFVSGERIYYTSTTQNGLTQNTYYYVLAAGLTATECRIGLTSTGSAVALTNGTGLSLSFSELINRVGVNTASPGYTLDVNGDASVSGDIYLSGYQIDINSPAPGEVITFDGTKFINNNRVSSTQAAERFVTEYQNNAAGVTSALFVRKNYTATPYTTGDGTAVVLQVDSDSQPVASFASLGGSYSATTPSVGLAVSTNNFATAVSVARFDVNSADFGGTTLILNGNHTGTPTQNAQLVIERGSSTDASLTWNESVDQWQFTNDLLVAGDVAVNGGDLTTTQTVGNLFNANATTVNVGNGATTEVNLGSVGSGRVQVKSPELDLNGGTLTFLSEVTGTPALNAQIVVERGTSADATLTWDESQDRWEFNNAIEVQGQITGTGNLDLNGNTILLRSGATVNGDANIIVDRGAGDAVIKWNSGTSRWQTSVDGTNYLNIPNQNLDLTSDVTFSSINLDGAAVMNTFGATTTSTAAFTLDSTPRNAIKCMVYMSRGTDSHAVEILIMRTSTDALMTTYGEMYTTTPLATFTADLSGGLIRIRATPTSATSTTFSTVRTALT